MNQAPFTKPSPTPIQPLFLTDDESGKVAGVTGRTIRTWRKLGLASIKIGGTRRTKLDDLVAFLERFRQQEGGNHVDHG